MSRIVAGAVGSLLLGSAVSVLATLAVPAAWASVRYDRRLVFFRCRVGPPAAGRRLAP